MTESSSDRATAATSVDFSSDEHLVDRTPAVPEVVVHSGLPVIDLRSAMADDAAFIVVDGALLLQLTDGSAWPILEQSEDGAVALWLADGLLLTGASVAGAALARAAPLPLASIAEMTVDPIAASPITAEPQTDTGASAVRGGALLRTFELADLGPPLQPALALAPSSGYSDRFARSSHAMALEDHHDGTTGGARFFNLAPDARDDLANTSERQAIRIDVLANDRDPNPGDQLRIVGFDAAGVEGRVTLLADGTFRYDPHGRFTHLGQGEQASESFTYTVADSHGATSTAKVTVTVAGVNDAPLAANDHAKTSEKAPVGIVVLANDNDPDGTDTIKVVAIDTTGLKGTATLNPSGSITYNPNGQFTHLGQGQHSFETFRYTIADQHGATSTAEVTIRIDGVNDAPIAHDDFVVVSEKGDVRFDALANDQDPDQGDTIRVVGLFSMGGSMGQRWVNHDGTITYRPFGAYDHLGEGEIAYQRFGYTIADQHGATSQTVVTVKVIGVNDAPVAENDQAVTTGTTAVVIDVLANDHDPDQNDTLQLVGVDTTGLLGSVHINADGTLTYDPNGHLGKGQTATESFSYTVSDQHGATSSAQVTVRVDGVDDAPTAITLSAATVAENAAGAEIGTLAAEDPDAGDRHGFSVDDHRFEVVDGKLKLKDGISLDFEAAPTVTVEVTATDSGGLSYAKTFTIEVQDVNEAPSDITLDSASVAENAAGAVIGTLTTTDPDAGDSHSYSVDDARFEVVNGDLKLKDCISLDFETEATVQVQATATDSGGLAVTRAFVIEVIDVNEAPSDIALDGTTVAENAAGAVIGTLITSDPDVGDSHDYSVDDARFEIVADTLKLKNGVSLDFEAEPTVEVEITSTDSGGLAVARTFTIAVQDVNEAPSDVALSAATVEENAAGAIIGQLTTTDPDAGDSHSYSVDDPRFEVVDGTLKLKDGVSLDFEAEPAVQVEVTATDSGGLGLAKSFSIEVIDVNEAPTDVALSAATVAENAAGAVIGHLTTSDPDAGDSHSYSVDDNRFEVVDGDLKLKDGVSLDFESEPTVQVEVTSTDSGGLGLAKSFTIEVIDVNEAPTDIALSTATVAENAAGVVIGQLTTSDPDADDSHSYSVNDDRFEVVNGDLKLKDGISLDFEAEPAVNVEVTATDSGGLSLAKSFTIEVLDVNEAPTDIALSAALVEENAAGAVIGTLTTDDPDAGDSHVYSIDDPRFEVVNGELKLVDGVGLDFETEPTVQVQVTATDSGGLAVTKSFTIEVLDVNEAPTGLGLSATIAAGYVPGAVIGTLSTVDADHGDSHSYSVDDPRFEVVGDELRLKAWAALDPKVEPTLGIEVTTTDAGGLSHAETLTVTVVGSTGVGPETLVNTETAATQATRGASFGGTPAAALDGGGFVVTWECFNQDGSGYGIYGQRFDAAGGAAGPEFRINTYTNDDQIHSTVAALDGGGFVITWTSLGQDGSGHGIYGQRFDATGDAIGPEFRVNTYTNSGQAYSSVAALDGGGFFVTWSSFGQDGSGYGVYGQRFDAAGDAVGPEFQINTYTANNQLYSSVASLDGGGFVVTWASGNQDGSSWGIYGQRFDATGSAIGTEFRVNTYTTDEQIFSSVAALDGGGFVVTWASHGQDGSSYGIFGQRYDAAGEAIGTEFQVNTHTANSQYYPSVATLDGGGFVVTWMSANQDGSGWGVYGQRYDAEGAAMGDEFLVNATIQGSQIYPGVVGLPGGDFAVVWSGNGVGDTSGVFLRVFSDGEVQVGTVGDDTLTGGGGDNLLIGMAGDDILDGRGGDNTLIGGPGADIFVVSATGGTNTIKDFSAAEGDMLRLDDILIGLGAIDGEGLSAYLDIAIVDTATVLRIDASGTGDFADPDGLVVFENADLAGGATDQAAILQSLVDSGQLAVAAA